MQRLLNNLLFNPRPYLVSLGIGVIFIMAVAMILVHVLMAG